MSDLVKRFLARDSMTADEEAQALAELERLNDERDARAVRLALGRKTAAGFSKAWGDGIRNIWFNEALEAARVDPGLLESPKALAQKVLVSCNAKGITKRNGQPYEHATIYNFLTGKVTELAEALENFTTQARDVEQQPAEAG